MKWIGGTRMSWHWALGPLLYGLGVFLGLRCHMPTGLEQLCALGEVTDDHETGESA